MLLCTLNVCFNTHAMSKVCQLCQKSYLKGNQIARGIGRRVARRTLKHQKVNLRSKKLIINGTPLKVLLCASCLKRINFEAKNIRSQNQANA